MFSSIRKNKKLVIISCLCCFIFITIWLSDLTLTNESADTWCFDEPYNVHNRLMELTDHLQSKHRPPIFFVETSCRSRSNGVITLNERQACAIESAAKMNPNSDIYILFVAQTTFPTNNTDPILQQLLLYRNIYFRHIYLLHYTQNTILGEWYQKRYLHHSVFAKSHTSDLLRYLTLWKFGGTYLDLDVVVISSLEYLQPNYAGAEDDLDVDAGILNFDSNGIGHKLVEQCLYELRDHYEPNEWGANGPGVITRILMKHCNAKNTKEIVRERCQDFHVYPYKVFYAIPWNKWELFFNETSSKDVMNMLNESRMIHVWNKFSQRVRVKVGSKQPYGLIAEQYCPNVYKHSGKFF